MTLRKIALTSVIALWPLAAVWAGETAPTPANEPPATATPVETKDCLHASSVDHTTVIDDQNILYWTGSNKVWRNHLDEPCHNLGFQQGFITTIRAGEICTHQPITVIHERNFCFLGTFYKEDAAKLGY